LYEPLAKSYKIIQYDPRGCGHSDRATIDFSMDAMIRDLEAVVEKTSISRFALMAFIDGVPIALTFAAKHPEFLTHLVLCDGWAKFADWESSPVHQVETAIRDKDWRLYTETFANVLWGLEDRELTRQFAAFMRNSSSEEALRAAYAAMESYDATPALSQVAVPTLVVHNQNNHWQPLPVGRRIAAGIPGARLAVIDDLFWTPVPDLVREFTGAPAPPEVVATPATPSGTAIILFADIADSTALTERLGDDAFRATARDLDTALRAIIREHSGTPIEGKLLGDGVLAVFTSARQAIEAALACARSGADASLPLHLGLHAGDVLREKDASDRENVYGGAVNIASRISGLSAPGEVLVSETVRSLARTSAGVSFEDRGEQALKGVGEPVRVWAVRAPPLSPSSGEGSPRSGGGEGT
jgi:class 3 adenylate cyclase/pimeloyl-ACP methyl ester carboxylesterase